MNRLRSAIALAVVAFLPVAGCSGEEQGGLEGASPGPDAVVGGEVVEIVLFYDDIIVAVDGSVTGPDGTELAAEYLIDTDIRAVVELDEPLSAPGQYEVRHVVDAVDGDRVEERFSFTFEPDAPAPQLVFPPEESGWPWLLWLIGVIGLVVIGVAGWQLLRSMARLRAPSEPPPAE